MITLGLTLSRPDWRERILALAVWKSLRQSVGTEGHADVLVLLRQLRERDEKAKAT